MYFADNYVFSLTSKPLLDVPVHLVATPQSSFMPAAITAVIRHQIHHGRRALNSLEKKNNVSSVVKDYLFEKK